jgi:hypothetical protein
MTTETEAAEETRVCGVTAFSAPPAPTYRYVLACQSGKLKIHIVDVATKKEWCVAGGYDVVLDAYGCVAQARYWRVCRCSGYLTEDKYMTSRNRIGNGTLTDYVAVPSLREGWVVLALLTLSVVLFAKALPRCTRLTS